MHPFALVFFVYKCMALICWLGICVDKHIYLKKLNMLYAKCVDLKAVCDHHKKFKAVFDKDLYSSYFAIKTNECFQQMNTGGWLREN